VTDLPFLVIVRRGQDRFRILAEAFAHDAIPVVWDRRTDERRPTDYQAVSAERRLRDRRGIPPVSWTALGYVVADGGLRRPGTRRNA